jgi:NADH-quinone oxidoreductase subunit G
MAEETKPATPAAAPKPPAGPPPPPPPKNPGFVTATIDGREVVVKPGTSVIQASQELGIDIPYYCYHKRLPVAANCRMCLVEMSNAPMGKLMPACQVPLAEGITVKTDTPRVRDQQRAVLEFILLNHPVDCPVCDQAGECKLQDYYMKFDAKPSRLDMKKTVKGKRVPLGPLVVIDQERCILCTRCVRFMREVAKAPQLGVSERGNECFITTFEGQPLDSKYSGNVVDVCPVGALTSTDFRFAGRVWFMSSAQSICTGCARGCNVHLDHLNDQTFRYRPRENEAVNQEWICDDGRLSYKALNQDRVLAARAAGKTPGRAAAVEAAAQALGAHAKAGTLGVLLSPVASLEDLLAASLVARETLGVAEVYVGGRKDGWSDELLKKADENPNRKGLELAAQAFGLTVKPFADLAAAVSSGKVRAVWAVGGKVPDEGLAAKIAGAELLVVQAVNVGPLTAPAAVLLPATPHSEMDGTFVNFEGRAQRFELAYKPKGEARPHWTLAAELSGALGKPLPWQSTREVFEALSPKLGAALGDFKWDSVPKNRKKFGIFQQPAGTVDGRLPGNRDRAPSETSNGVRAAAARNP